jgi:hypothetical protein
MRTGFGVRSAPFARAGGTGYDKAANGLADDRLATW